MPQVVQACAERFGSVTAIERQFQANLADARWYVQHIAGCVVGFAVRQQTPTFDEAWAALGVALRSYYTRVDFEERYQTKAIQSGTAAGKDGR